MPVASPCGLQFVAEGSGGPGGNHPKSAVLPPMGCSVGLKSGPALSLFTSQRPADGLGRPGGVWRTFPRDPKSGPDGRRGHALPELLHSQPSVLAV